MTTLTISSLKHPTSTDVSYPSPQKRIVEIAEAIITYFIPYNLRRSVEHCKLEGLPKHYLIPPKHPPELFTFIASVCTQLREDNADFFDNLPESMSLQQNNAKAVYISVCKTVFADNVINWGRVMSIFTMAATFSVYFTKKGELSVVTKVPQWLVEVVENELVDWIIEQGGWEDVRNSLAPKTEPSKWSRVIAYGAMMATAGFLLFRIRKGKLL